VQTKTLYSAASIPTTAITTSFHHFWGLHGANLHENHQKCKLFKPGTDFVRG